MAANDPAGVWKVVIGELLADTEDTAKFTYSPAASCGAIAGAVPRAVSFGNERENVYRFFRTHHEVTVVSGKGDHAAAAARLAEIFKPWGVRVKTMAVEEAAKARTIAPEEAATWCGLHPGKVLPGDKNSPGQVGFAVQGPVLLVGSPDDHPLIKYARDQGFLPYAPHRTDFPGKGRGMVAWQRDCVGLNQESIALIATDAAGMSEAVGTLYEMAAGIEAPLPLLPPAASSVSPASKGPARIDEPATAWKVALPDRAVALKPLGTSLLALTEVGSLTAIDETGKIAWQRTFDAGEELSVDVSDRLIVVGATHRVLGFDASGKQVFDVPARFVTCVAVSPDGALVAFGTADGTLSLADAAGKVTAAIGGDARNPKPYLSAIFSGTSLIALTSNEAHTIADGKIAQKTGGVSGKVPPIRRGDTIVPADGKLPGAKAGVVGLSDDAVGSEMDGGVRLVKDGKVAWEHKAVRKLTKRIAANGGRVAVAYWGGSVSVLDGGAVTSARAFPADVADLAWSGDRLVVGLADGRLFGLEVK